MTQKLIKAGLTIGSVSYLLSLVSPIFNLNRKVGFPSIKNTLELLPCHMAIDCIRLFYHMAISMLNFAIKYIFSLSKYFCRAEVKTSM